MHVFTVEQGPATWKRGTSVPPPKKKNGEGTPTWYDMEQTDFGEGPRRPRPSGRSFRGQQFL